MDKTYTELRFAVDGDPKALASKAIEAAFLAAREKIEITGAIHDGPAEMYCEFYFSIPKGWPDWKRKYAAEGGLRGYAAKGAISDLIAPVMVGLFQTAYANVAEITDLQAVKRYAAEPHTVVTLWLFQKPSRAHAQTWLRERRS